MERGELVPEREAAARFAALASDSSNATRLRAIAQQVLPPAVAPTLESERRRADELQVMLERGELRLVFVPLRRVVSSFVSEPLKAEEPVLGPETTTKKT